MNQFLEGIVEGAKTSAYVSGEVAKKVAFASVLATGVGLYQFLTGGWPFKTISGRDYLITQTLIDTRGPVLEGPGTRTMVYPLIKPKLKDGKEVILSAQTQERGCELKFRTLDNLEGKMKVQFLWRIDGPKGAKRFFWDFGANPGAIDEVVRGELSRIIADNVQGEYVARGRYIDSRGTSVNYLEEAEDASNSKLKDLRVGIKVENFAILKPDFDTNSQAILSATIKATKDAEALRIRAHAEAVEAQIQANVTSQVLSVYSEAARNALGARASKAEVSKLAA